MEYKPKRFAAAIMRIREPKTTALIFRSGKMVCTGAKSEQESYTAAKNYAKQLKKIGNPTVQLTDFTIQNIVGSHDVGFNIKLESLHIMSVNRKVQCRYDPELFPDIPDPEERSGKVQKISIFLSILPFLFVFF